VRLIIWTIGALGALAFATVGSATTCPSDTWCFGAPTTGNNISVADGSSYSSALGTIYVYGEQIKNGANGGSYYSSSNGTINGLFATNDNKFDEGVGIAPYDPAEGSSNYDANQDGITNVVNGNGTYGDIMVVELGANIAQGTTLSFLLQAGIGASSDTVSAYWQDGGSSNVSPNSMTNFANTTAGQISTNGTTSQFSLTKNTSGIEFVAIEADCHYILLDTITGTPGTSPTPEPRFYGLLLAGLLGVAGMAYHKRRTAQANA
jgi:hypothetical protein